MHFRSFIHLILVLSSLTVGTRSAHADIFEVGQQKVEVPAPAGYVRVTPEMKAVYDYLQQLADPANDILAFYISEADAKLARAGEIPTMNRNFALKANKALRQRTVSVKDFSQLKDVLVTQNQQIFEQATKEASSALKDVSKGLSQNYDMKLALDVGQMLPLSAHIVTENELSFSMMIKFNMALDGAQECSVVAATSAVLNVGGALLFLYTYAPEKELEWTRQASADWTKSVFQSNQALKAPQGRSSFVWRRILLSGLIGGLVAGLLFLLTSFGKKK